MKSAAELIAARFAKRPPGAPQLQPQPQPLVAANAAASAAVPTVTAPGPTTDPTLAQAVASKDPAVALEAYKRLFREAREMTVIPREQAKIYRRYYDGKIDPKLQRALKRKRQPDFTINRVRPGVEGMVGVVDKGKSDPRCYPRNPQNEDASEVATDSLRYVADTNRWHQNKLKVFRNMCIEGTAAVIVEVDGQLDVKVNRIRFEEYFYDPYAREPDLSDKSYDGMAKWRWVDEIVSDFPAREQELRASCDRGVTLDPMFGDRPQDGYLTSWTDAKRKRLLQVEMYKLEAGVWNRCVFVGDILLEEGASPYQDDRGRPCNPIEAQSVFVDDDNHRYGVVADMVGPQDEINTYRRKAAHLATFRQVQETDPISAYADPEEVRREASRPDGVIPPGYAVVANDKFQMDLELLQEAKAEIERIGPNPAILGRQGADSSGRASLIRQQAGLTELAHLFQGLEDLELRVYRQCWSRIRQFWTQPKFIRVTDDEQAFDFIQINEPVWGPPAPVIDPATGFPQYDPVTRQVVIRPKFLGVRNSIANMEVDIIVDTTPDTANVQQEQYNGLLELARIPGALGNNPGKVLLQASSLPKKRELIEMLEQEQAQAAQAPPSPQQQLEVQQAQATVAKTGAQAQEAQARAVKLTAEAHTTPVVEFTKGQLQQAKAVNMLTTIANQQQDTTYPLSNQTDV